MKNILTIAGFDPSCGAGIQADIKTFAALNTYGLSIATALTIQNSQGVVDTYEINPEIIEKEFQTLIDDIQIHAIKIGMIYNEPIIDMLVPIFNKHKFPIIVYDPVILSKNKFCLLQEAAFPALIEKLLPLITLITPNFYEAQILSGIEIKNESDLKKAAQIIKNYGPKYVLIKSAEELDASIFDLLYDGEKFTKFPIKKIENHQKIHGTGCALSSAIAANLVKGHSVDESILNAQNFLSSISKSLLKIGKENLYINHFSDLEIELEKNVILKKLKLAYEKLYAENIGHLLPEVQSNFVYALESAITYNEVAGFPSRIIRVDSKIGYIQEPDFGKNKHIPSVIIAVISYFPNLRSCMNIKYSEEILNACKSLGYIIYSFNREDEPEQNRQIEGKSLDWGTKSALANAKNLPDIIYDIGGFCKEPMIRVIGHEPEEVADKIIAIRKACYIS